MKNTRILVLFIVGLIFSIQYAFSQEKIVIEIPDTPYDGNNQKTKIEKQLIGTWEDPDNRSEKLVFTNDGKLKKMSNGNIRLTETYQICRSCGDETLSGDNYFLKTTMDNGVIQCAYLDNVNYKNTGLLTLVTQNQGKILIYRKQ